MYLKVYIHSLSIITINSCMHKDLNQWFTTCNIHIGVLCDYYQDDQKNPEPLISLFCMGRLSIISPMITKQMSTVLLLYFRSSWHPRLLCYFIWASSYLQTMRLSIIETMACLWNYCFLFFQIPYTTMSPLQAAVGVRQVGSYNHT